MPAALARLPARPAPWVRDFVLVGALTGFLAPAVFFSMDDWLYPALTGAGGALAGVGVGFGSSLAMAGRMRQMRRVWLFPLGLLIGAVWGAAAGAMPAAGGMTDSMLGISVVVAAIAGCLQLGWFWFAYCVRRVNHRSTWPVVLAATAISTVLGFAAASVFLGRAAF